MVTLSVALLALTLFQGASSAQTARFDAGRGEFESSCAVCHGVNGKGDGAFWAILQQPTRATDLTTLSKRNGGVFPLNRVYETIEGANIPSHGSRDMPIWGATYRVHAAQYESAFEVPYDPEAYVRNRILTLIEYISRLQER